MKSQITVSAIVVTLLFASSVHAQKTTTLKPSRYAIVEIGTQDSTTRTSASAVNDRGEVSGSFTRPDKSQAFVRDSSASYKTLVTNSAGQVNARNISPWGTVVGDAVASDLSRRAFRWDAAAGMTTLTVGEGSLAYGINGAGETVGEFTSNGQKRGFFWDRFGNVTELTNGSAGTLSSTAAYGVNNNQQAAGFTIGSDGFSHAFIWMPGVGMKQFFPGSQNSAAYAINDAAQIAGTLQTSQGWKAFVLDTTTGAYTAFPALSAKATSMANSINANGIAVGQSANLAALYMSGKTYDLNSLVSLPAGLVLTNATSINVNGQIVVSGTQNGVTRSFLLTPLS